MATLFSVTAPLMIRYPDGEKHIMVERFPLKDGLLYLEPFWTERHPDEAFRKVLGDIRGEGPWKVGEAVITVLGCQGTDAEMADLYARWQTHMQQPGFEFPPWEIVEDLARSLGAVIDASSA